MRTSNEPRHILILPSLKLAFREVRQQTLRWLRTKHFLPERWVIHVQRLVAALSAERRF